MSLPVLKNGVYASAPNTAIESVSAVAQVTAHLTDAPTEVDGAFSFSHDGKEVMKA
jgi:hypothetical protein